MINNHSPNLLLLTIGCVLLSASCSNNPAIPHSHEHNHNTAHQHTHSHQTLPSAAHTSSGKQKATPSNNPSSLNPFQNQASAAVHFLRPLFPVLDCEGVGEIGKGEVDEHFFEIFFYADRDHSRSITREEYVNSIHNSSRDKDSYIFTLMDTNADDIVSTTEFREHVFLAIDAADINQDGTLTQAEAKFKPLKRRGQ